MVVSILNLLKRKCVQMKVVGDGNYLSEIIKMEVIRCVRRLECKLE